MLEQVAIFATLTKDERAGIATKLKQAIYYKGHTLVEPGTVLKSLFIIGRGVLSVTQTTSRGDVERMRLGPGDHFGEIGLLTETPSFAKITTFTDATVYELTKEDLAPVLKARPQVAQELCRVLAQRQALGRAIAAVEPGKTMSTPNVAAWFSERVHRLIDLYGT